jgi:hypothetical protein
VRSSMFTPSEEQLINLLGAGITQRAAANAVGISEARVSQLMALPEFSDKVSILRVAGTQKDIERDNKYDELEDKALKKLGGALDFVSRPMEILKIVSTLNAAKRRREQVQNNNTGTGAIVQLILPTIIVEKHQVQLGAANQAVAIDGKELAPAPITMLENLNEQRKINNTKALSISTLGSAKLSDIS